MSFALGVGFLYRPGGWFLMNSGLARGSYKTISTPCRIILIHLIPSRFINMAEKDAAVVHLENQPGQGISTEDAEFLSNFSNEAKKRVLRKVSLRKHNIRRSY
jgi:hypothetical protein